MKYLVVDDELVSRKKLQLILSEQGPADAAEDGEHALELIKAAFEKNTPYDYIFLDFELPGMDGAEVLTQLRNIERSTGKPASHVIMVTAHADRDVVTSCIKAGCDGYVVKPFQRDAILAKIGIAAG